MKVKDGDCQCTMQDYSQNYDNQSSYRRKNYDNQSTNRRKSLQNLKMDRIAELGPVVQSIVSLTSSLRGHLIKCFRTLQPNTLIFFVEKMREAFAMQKLPTFFQQEIWHFSDINVCNFNKKLANDVVSFEQLGPEI